MTSNKLKFYLKIGAVTVVLLAAVVISTRIAAAESAKTNIQDEWQAVGIINPAGTKRVWMIPSAEGTDLHVLLARFPSKLIDGVKFYQVSSWRDTARLLTFVNEQQARALLQLAQDIQKLEKRLVTLEKKQRRVVYSGSMDGRVKALEKKMDDMFDGGLP
ncbi:hypothetical protein D1AOALGA4SA_4924 [Olavius algarvensis Delta 1 endosymbiont]|nr:hypothetical protein D1AOALGA4SA_4924 [Olavius algarvensis Delta 1 endosymbiont]